MFIHKFMSLNKEEEIMKKINKKPREYIDSLLLKPILGKNL